MRFAPDGQPGSPQRPRIAPYEATRLEVWRRVRRGCLRDIGSQRDCHHDAVKGHRELGPPMPGRCQGWCPSGQVEHDARRSQPRHAQVCPPLLSRTARDAAGRRSGPGDGDLAVGRELSGNETSEFHRGRLDEDTGGRVRRGAGARRRVCAALLVVGPVVLRPRRRVGQQVKCLLDLIEALRSVGSMVHVRVVPED